jgi:hypothetical protein
VSLSSRIAGVADPSEEQLRTLEPSDLDGSDLDGTDVDGTDLDGSAAR